MPVVAEEVSAVQSCCRGSEREKDIQDRIWHFEKRMSEILKISGFFLTFTATLLVRRSHLALNKDFSQRKHSTDKSPGRRDVLFHQAVKYFTLKKLGVLSCF